MEPAPPTLAQFAESAYARAEELDPAIESRVTEVVANPGGNGTQHARHPAQIKREDYLANVNKRIDHARNPAEPSPWRSE